MTKRRVIKNWDEIALGGSIVEPGTSEDYHTGSWRTFRPVFTAQRCVHCMMCWVYCPDSAVLVQDGRVLGFDYEHCKGCALCATVCPDKSHAIDMVRDNNGQETGTDRQ
jgi:pyruvate ferredoxin oxidoreductase delta subunit